MTRLTVVPLRSSLIQGNDKNLRPLSTPRLELRRDYREKVPTSARNSTWAPEWLTVLPKSFQSGIPIQPSLITFSGRVCSKALTLGVSSKYANPDEAEGTWLSQGVPRASELPVAPMGQLRTRVMFLNPASSV